MNNIVTHNYNLVNSYFGNQNMLGNGVNLGVSPSNMFNNDLVNINRNNLFLNQLLIPFLMEGLFNKGLLNNSLDNNLTNVPILNGINENELIRLLLLLLSIMNNSQFMPGQQPLINPSFGGSANFGAPLNFGSPNINSYPSNWTSSQPSNQVSSQPSNQVSSQPSNQVSSQPSNQVSSQPSNQVSSQPSNQVSSQPSQNTNGINYPSNISPDQKEKIDRFLSRAHDALYNPQKYVNPNNGRTGNGEQWDMWCLGFVNNMAERKDPALHAPSAKESYNQLLRQGRVRTDWDNMTPGSYVLWKNGQYGHIAIYTGERNDKGEPIVITTGWNGWSGLHKVPLSEVEKRIGKADGFAEPRL